MMIASTRRTAGVALLTALMLGHTTTASAQKGKAALTPDEARAQQAYALGVQAYIWGYPMVVMQKSRNAMTRGGVMRRSLPSNSTSPACCLRP
jgi:hypothetical protein